MAAGLDRLTEIGRQRGRVTIEDIRTIVPLDALSVTELAQILARLEEAGVTIDIDPQLLASDGKMPLPSAHELPLPENKAASAPMDRFEILARSIQAARETSTTLNSPEAVGGPATGYLWMVVGVVLLLLVAVWLLAR